MKLINVGLIVALACSGSALAADCVTTSDAVVNGVTLRAKPSGSSAPRGSLKKGDSLPLVSSMPRWYELRQPSGDSVFASKA